MNPDPLSPGHWQGLDALNQKPRYDAILDRIPDAARVLDVGCGTGVLGRLLEARGLNGDYVGVEQSADAVEAARRFFSLREVIHTSAEDFEPRASSYDVIVFNEMLYYLADPIGTLKRYVKALAPGGSVIVSIFLRHDRPSLKQRVLHFIDRRRPLGNAHCAQLVNHYLCGWRELSAIDIPISGSPGVYWRLWVASVT